MLAEFPQAVTLATIVAFLSGSVAAWIGGFFSRRAKARRQDPRDARIRSLEADVRVGHSATEKVRTQLDMTAGELTEARAALAARERELARLEHTVEQLRADLKDSVKKTRELREELTIRATENVRAELKLREVETELSLVQASTDLIATGMLDYQTPDGDEEEVHIFKAGTKQ